MIPDQTIILSNVQQALAEDLGEGDVTAALIPENCRGVAHILTREPMVLCGQSWVNHTFLQCDPSLQVQWLVNEAQWVDAGTRLCTIQGAVRPLLTAERTALNFLQTLSATATQTYQWTQHLKGYTTKLLDTRKTIPGLRYAQKYAVTCGGGYNHRMGLYDAFLIKENHIKASGSIREAIQNARHYRPDILVEIEVETLQELQDALREKPDRIMLDNFHLETIQQAVQLAKPYGVPLEVSGGVDMTHLVAIAETGVDFISVGSITKSVRAIDLSLQLTDIL